MSADWTRRVRPGDPLRISARAYNAFVDSAVAHMQRDVLAKERGATDSATHVLARNDGLVTRYEFTPVWIRSTNIVASNTNRRRKIVLSFAGTTLTSPLSKSAFMVLQEPIRPGAIGKAVISGVTFCKVGVPPSGEAPPSGTRLGMSNVATLQPDGDGPAVMLGGAPADASSFFYGVVRIDGGGGTFHAKINGSPEQIGTAARWRYSFTEVTLDFFNDTFVDVPLGRSDASLGRALNLLEVGNTASSAYSIPVAGTSFSIGSTGVLFRPVPAGTVVRLTVATSLGGSEQRPTFSAPNPVWGPCA